MTAKTKLTIAITLAIFVMASFALVSPSAASSAQVSITFKTSGYSTTTTSVIFTIDGTNFTGSSLPKTFNWKTGDTHTVKVTSSFTGADLKTYTFNSWTNGNGLTGTSGTYTVPSTSTTVTANFAQAIALAPTTLTITCTNSSADKGTAVTLSGILKSATSGLSSKTVTLTYYNSTTWCTIGSVTTTSDGSYSYSWTIPASLANGQYPVKATFSGDTGYQSCSATTGTDGNGVHLMVLPESIGSFVALGACFGGAIVFFKVRSKQAPKKA
jgi:hypothetical protein